MWIELFQHGLKVFKRGFQVGLFFLEIFLPVPPVTDKAAIIVPILNQVIGYREENGGLTTRIRRNPMVGMGGAIGQTNVKDDEFGPPPLGVHNALGVRIKIMARLQVSADEQYHLGMFMVGAGAVGTHPEMIAGAGSGRADIGMGVVAIDTPGGQDALGVSVFAGPTDMVHDFVVAVFLKRSPHTTGNIMQGFAPGDRLPLPLSTFSRSFQGLENAIGIADLVQCGRTLGTVPAA